MVVGVWEFWGGEVRSRRLVINRDSGARPCLPLFKFLFQVSDLISTGGISGERGERHIL